MFRLLILLILGWLFIKLPETFIYVFIYVFFGWLVLKFFGLFKK